MKTKALLLSLCPGFLAAAAHADVLAIKVGRAETVSKGVIEHAVIFVEDGKIVTIGEDLPIDRGIPVLDRPDWTVMPGLVNCHTHLHVIVIDGVYSRQEGGATRFHFVEPPWAQELASMVATISERVCRMLGRRGLMGEASHDSNESGRTSAAAIG